MTYSSAAVGIYTKINTSLGNACKKRCTKHCISATNGVKTNHFCLQTLHNISYITLVIFGFSVSVLSILFCWFYFSAIAKETKWKTELEGFIYSLVIFTMNCVSIMTVLL